MFSLMRKYMPPAPTPAPPSPFDWGRCERVRELLEKNFDLKFEEGVSTTRELDSETIWEKLSTGYGPTKTLVASLDTHRREELHRDFIDFHNEFLTELGIALTRTYLITVGTRR